MKRTIVVCVLIALLVLTTSCDRIQKEGKVFGMKRGINIGNALEAPNEGEWGVTVKDEYFKIIKDTGFDTVRIPIKWSAHAMPDLPYTIDKDFFDRIDHIVGQALEQKLYTIINIHHFDELIKEPEAQKERFLSIWQQIAEHYRDYPDKLYFEILNEPNGALDQYWNDYLAEAIEVIRKSNPDRILIAGPGNWNNISALENFRLPEDDKNIIVTFHYYNPFWFTHQGAGWANPSPPTGKKWDGTDSQKQFIEDEILKAVEWAKEHNRQLFMGEFGAYSKADMESRAKWTSFVARTAEKYDIAWAYWEFCSGFGAYDPVLNQWREPLLQALVPSE